MRIGMVADTRDASFGHWTDVSLSGVWSHYVQALDRGGAAPGDLPGVEAYEDAPELALELVDGLLLTGGRDLDAASYGADPDPANEPADPLRDRVELALARAAIERDLPVLGVCRGMHVLNVALGGGIDQHLADPDGVHRGEPGDLHQPSGRGRRRHSARGDPRRARGDRCAPTTTRASSRSPDR